MTDSKEPRKYWSVLKNRLKKWSELTTKCSQLKMKALDGKSFDKILKGNKNNYATKILNHFDNMVEEVKKKIKDNWKLIKVMLNY